MHVRSWPLLLCLAGCLPEATPWPAFDAGADAGLEVPDASIDAGGEDAGPPPGCKSSALLLTPEIAEGGRVRAVLLGGTLVNAAFPPGWRWRAVDGGLEARAGPGSTGHLHAGVLTQCEGNVRGTELHLGVRAFDWKVLTVVPAAERAAMWTAGANELWIAGQRVDARDGGLLGATPWSLPDASLHAEDDDGRLVLSADGGFAHGNVTALTSSGSGPAGAEAFIRAGAQRWQVLAGGLLHERVGATWSAPTPTTLRAPLAFDAEGGATIDQARAMDGGVLPGACEAFDPIGRRWMFFGGTTSDGGVSEALWSLTLDGDDARWERFSPELDAGWPPARTGCAATWDAPRKRLLVGLGRGALNETLGDVWLLPLGAHEVYE